MSLYNYLQNQFNILLENSHLKPRFKTASKFLYNELCFFADARYYFLNFKLHTHIFHPHAVDKRRVCAFFSISMRLFRKSQTSQSQYYVPKTIFCLLISIIISTKHRARVKVIHCCKNRMVIYDQSFITLLYFTLALLYSSLASST